MLASLIIAAALFASPQDAPAAPHAPPAAPAQPAGPTPEQMAVITRIQAAGEALEATMEELEPRAAAIRTDAALPAADKDARIRALLAEKQPVLDEFSAALEAMIMMQATSEGATAEQAAQAAAMVRDVLPERLAQMLITGERPDDDGE
ncbi:MAG: hypothetical protein IBJ02_05480 [Brevundimonas sp.]|nr:hypothetical protein [Brevundimonas sp.]